MELYSPDVHAIHETEVSKFLNRELGDPRFFTYVDRRTGNWCIGQWLGSGQFSEVQLGGALPTDEHGRPTLTREDMRLVVRALRPPDVAAARQRIRDGEYAAKMRHEDIIRMERENAAQVRAKAQRQGKWLAAERAGLMDRPSPNARIW